MPTIDDVYKSAKSLRRTQTKAEKLLWKELKAYNLNGHKFRRQHPIIYFKVNNVYDFYVADFYCASGKLIVEVDGEVHSDIDVAEKDKVRQAHLEELGYKVIRFTNNEVFKELQIVLSKIEKQINM